MVDSPQFVSIPLAPYFCDLVVFPSPYKESQESWFYLMKNSDVVPVYGLGSVSVKYIPGSVYCFLPSVGENKGTVRVFRSKPAFLEDFAFCLEITGQAIEFLTRGSDSTINTLRKVGMPQKNESRVKCTSCFISHFPQPNTFICKMNKHKKKTRSIPLNMRLRGGARTDKKLQIIERGVSNGKIHGIDLHPGVENLGNGNCVFECVIDSINTREVFDDMYDGAPDYWRYVWMSEVENIAFENWNKGYTREQWAVEWARLKNSRIYECELGDLVLPGVAHCVKKDIIIFNTSPKAHSPIYVVEASKLCGLPADSEVPICVAYDQSHYEMLVPDTEEDLIKTISLKKSWINGTYEKTMNDFPFLKSNHYVHHNLSSYAEIVKEDGNSSNQELSPNSVDTHLKHPEKSDTPKQVKKSKIPPNFESNTKGTGTEYSQELAELKKIGKKQRTEQQKIRYADLMKLDRNHKNKQRMANKRLAQSADERKSANAKESERIREKRAGRSADERKVANAKDSESKSKKRAGQSADERKKANAKESKRKESKRSTQSADERKLANKEDQMRKAQKRSSVAYKDGRRSKEILQGNFKVKSLQDTADSIGKMDVVCQHCMALKYVKESASTCCCNGKVLLDSFPLPPEEINKLWHANTAESKLFQEHARSINNAVCLASLKVNERRFQSGFTPNVIFEGKVTVRAGPLQAGEGERPYFSQLYVHDSSLETSQRFQNMHIPSNVSKSQKKMIESILKKVQNELHIHNPFIKDFKQIMEIPAEELGHGKLVISAKRRPIEEHERRYNAQMNLNEVSILTNTERHDLVLQKRGGGLHTISDLNPKGMPLHFTLLFPHGTYGWNPETRHVDGKRRVTPREFYVFYLNQRDNEKDYIHSARRLYQEWTCMAWVTVENQKLLYQRLNQKALRADTYRNVKEATEVYQLELAPREDGMFKDDNQQPALGRKILSSSFSGSPRWYNAKFQDGMAICREYHKPDFFITMTCNPNWQEIKDQLKEGQNAQDRPDIVARVFKLKKDQLMQDLKSGHLLGKVVAHMHVVEFQKRGLPHVHILIILADNDREMTPEMVDDIVVAELPPDPDEEVDIAKALELKRLQDIVLTNMIHGPCGTENPDCPCMEAGRCTKNFPKEFCKETIIDQDSNYATYRRRSPEDGGRQVVCPKSNRIIDNRYVVPYSPFLLLRFNCHINVERCTSPKATKYLYKYVTKGSDRAMVSAVVEEEPGKPRDEIAEYEDLRSVGSSEATWHLMAFPITDRYPPVQALRVHLEDQQQVVFDEGSEEEALEKQRDTELTAFFKLNQQLCEQGAVSLPLYIDVPKKFRYDKQGKEWIKRTARSEDTVIGRVHTVNPVAGEVFYLRILLHNNHCRGKTSFEALKKLENGRVCETYKEVCRELGLLRDDLEWERVLEECAVTKLCPQIRELFIIILMFCQPSNPAALFQKFWHTWVDDFEQRSRKQSIILDENQLWTMLLLDLELQLQSFEKELVDFGLPKPNTEDINRVQTITNTDPVVIREEKDYSIGDLEESVKRTVPMFTQEQKEIFETILKAVRKQESICVFIDARGGCGKTFLLNTILSAVRSLEPSGCVALAMATTGIASNLLNLGRTFHSRLKAPLTATEESLLQVSAQSSLAKLIRIARLLLIDEATMLDRFQLEALDRTLRDLTGSPNVPFGGKIVLLAGDFRQCLPVVPRANRAGTVGHCINASNLWQYFKIMQLTENMRVRASGDPILEQFDKWTLDIGNGFSSEGFVEIPENMVTRIKANTKEDTHNEERSMKYFCQEVFPDICNNINKPGWLEGRTILAPTNKEVDALNEVMQRWLPEGGTKFHSADTLENPEDVFRFNTEYLNTLRPNGFPQHVLCLKTGMPLMLLRNINPRQGLCNGTRLIYDKCIDNKLLQCRIVETGRIVLIPRITFIPKMNEYPFEWQRRQFPVRTAFAITINKSQGQTLKYAGVWLRTQVFTHGQLYVACSRVSSPDNLKFALMAEPDQLKFTADNIVYKEVLLHQNIRSPETG